jgi:dipeptidyl-peptidase-4
MEFLIKIKPQTGKILLICLSLVVMEYGYAQKKQLSEEQIKGNGIQQARPPIRLIKWVNDNIALFEKYSDGSRKYFSIETSKGNQKEISEEEFKKQLVSRDDIPTIKDGDIVIGSEKITDTKAEEKNPTLSPDGKYLAFTRDNDLYVIRLSDKREFRLTRDGSEVILNGFSSWVYMEEILGRYTNYKAFWWSPDSKSLAFFRSDDSEVPQFTITDCTDRHGYVETMRYSKPGDKNPKVRIGIVGAEGGAPVWADFNENDDQYFCEPFWTLDSKSLWIQWANRAQNNLKIYKVNTENGAKTEIYNEIQKAWISIDQNNRVRFLSDGRAIIASDKSGYNHLYLHDADGKLVNPITSGDFTVLDVTAIDEKAKTVYFTCYKDNIGCTDFYKTGFDGKNLQRLSFGHYTNTVSLSPENKYFVLTYSNCTTPPKVALYSIKGKLVAELDDARNPEADEYEWAKTEIVTVKSRDGQFDLPMRIIYPLNFDRNKKYPVLIDVYGGPSAVQVRDGWRSSTGLSTRYAADGLIQASIDHRGSLHFGKRGQDMMYRNLGKMEIDDYSRCVEWLVENASVNPEKVCINGFSYGGYITAYALTYGANIFTHGIAGGSVIDWTLYDAPYTERFMSTPDENPDGYRESSVLTHADKLKGKLLLTHGILDENVHVQNTYQLVSKLEDLNKDFELMLYPSSRHGYRGAKRIHFRDLQIKFIYKYLLEKPIPE